jgi:hypothetical protein
MAAHLLIVALARSFPSIPTRIGFCNLHILHHPSLIALDDPAPPPCQRVWLSQLLFSLCHHFLGDASHELVSQDYCIFFGCHHQEVPIHLLASASHSS